MWMLLMFGLGKSLLAGANLLVSAKQLREALPRVGLGGVLLPNEFGFLVRLCAWFGD